MSARFDFSALPPAARLELATELLDSIADQDPALLVCDAERRSAAAGRVAEERAPYTDDEMDDDELDELIAREDADGEDEDGTGDDPAPGGHADDDLLTLFRARRR